MVLSNLIVERYLPDVAVDRRPFYMPDFREGQEKWQKERRCCTVELKLSAASCGEFSILKRNKQPVYARLPRSSCGEWLAGGFNGDC
jgi:hypothetical protein